MSIAPSTNLVLAALLEVSPSATSGTAVQSVPAAAEEVRAASMRPVRYLASIKVRDDRNRCLRAPTTARVRLRGHHVPVSMTRLPQHPFESCYRKTTYTQDIESSRGRSVGQASLPATDLQGPQQQSRLQPYQGWRRILATTMRSPSVLTI